ncbi:unnamed protein product, partial [Rotaria sordida]
MQYDITFDSSYICIWINIYIIFKLATYLKQLTLTSSSLPILTVTVVGIITGTDVFTKTCLSDEQSFNKLFYSSQMLIIGLINGLCD